MSAKKHVILLILFISILAINFRMNSKNMLLLKKATGKIVVQNPDSLYIIKNIIGEWIWDSTYFIQNRTINYAGLYYKIEFTDNHFLKVFENNELIKTAKWSIYKEAGSYIITTVPPVDYVSGVVNLTKYGLKLIDKYPVNSEYYFSQYSDDEIHSTN